jgi:eukaryotic-like serine/threonine-protein kinase
MALDTPLGAAAKLGRYELLKEQAKSGLGTTWLARSSDEAGDAPLRSLLRVQKSLVKKAELAEALLTDARRAEALQHPSALRVIEAGNEDGEIYLVTEHAEGEALSGLVTASGPAGLPLPIVLRVLLDTLGAVAAAHAQGAICHGELSPQHLLVGVDGVTRVIGFGTARGLARLPLLGAKNGDRLAYAAPERVKSMASPIAAQVALEPRADVFSLGVILWEGVTKQRLFSSKIEAAVIQKVLTAPIAAPGTIAGVSLPGALDEAIQKALDRDPARRFQSAGELLAAVEAGAENAASHADVAELVEKLAGKAIAARRNQIGAPSARTARAPTIPPPRPMVETRPSVPEEERPTAPMPKAAEAKPATPKPAEAKIEVSMPAAKPVVMRKQTLLGVAAPKIDALKTAVEARPETPKPVVAKPEKPPPPPPRPEFESVVDDLDDGFDIDVGSTSEPPAEPVKAAPPKPPPPPAPALPAIAATPTPLPAVKPVAPSPRGKTLMLGSPVVKSEEPVPVPASTRAETVPEVKIEPVAVATASALLARSAGPLSERKTGGTPTTDTPTSDPAIRGKSATAIDKIGPASTLGRYEILTPIARGGMASVWAARLMGTRGFQKLVAVKTMLPDVSDDPDFEQMFLDEARVAARIRHPNVAEILDLGEQDDVLYLVMEWVDGENLSVVLKAARALGGMPLPVILRIASQACAGLHAAHELRDDSGNLVDLIHRDVSPANVLVSMAGFVKLVDFGVAKSKGRMHVTRAGGMVKGKTPYLSPEQLGGLPLDRRSDIFSFGALLYVMATGLHPFRGETEGKTVENIALKNPVPLRTINAALPVEFEKLVLKALEKDPKNRFSTAAELQRALDQIGLALGEPASESEVAEFVRKAIGEAQAKRAADIKSAIASLDALTSGSGDVPRSDALRFLDARRTTGSTARADIEAESAKSPPSSVKPASDESAVAVDLDDGVAAAKAPVESADEAAAIDVLAPIEAEAIRPPPLKVGADEETSPPSTLDEPASAAPVRPRSKRMQVIVGAVIGACALVAILAFALGGGGKSATGPAHADATTTTAPTVTAPTTTAIAAVDAPPPAPTPTVAIPPPPASVDVAPPTTAVPTSEPVVPPSKWTPKGKVPVTTGTPGKPVKPPVKPPITKKYDPKGI